jgi:hypothetical protein
MMKAKQIKLKKAGMKATILPYQSGKTIHGILSQNK